MNDRRLPSDPAIRAWAWRWGRDEDRRPGLPWIGIFLVVFGGLLLLERALPDYRRLGDVAVLAAGLASLAAWLLRRNTIALYAGAFLTAVALPGTIEALGQPLGDGWGTLFFGLAFWLVAAVRASQGGGYGWQALYGAILVLIGGSEIVRPELAAVALPLILVAIGVLLLVRGGRPR
jgi:hypothetical protein